jgi:uncharacterized membrane protein
VAEIIRPDEPGAPKGGPATPAEVWSFRGHDLRAADFSTAMIHLYRGEVQRSVTWRTRLDTTTNWAVITTGAGISFALADPAHHYGVIILNTLLVALFLWIEARRYRYYELWTYRVRLLETDFFGAMLVPPFTPRPDWAESLAGSLKQPEFPITMWEAFGRRYRLNYVWLFMVLGLAWAIKGLLHPVPVESWPQFVSRSALGPIPGWVMVVVGVVYNGALLVIGIATARLTRATGEILTPPPRIRLIGRFWGR